MRCLAALQWRVRPAALAPGWQCCKQRCTPHCLRAAGAAMMTSAMKTSKDLQILCCKCHNESSVCIGACEFLAGRPACLLLAVNHLADACWLQHLLIRCCTCDRLIRLHPHELQRTAASGADSSGSGSTPRTRSEAAQQLRAAGLLDAPKLLDLAALYAPGSPALTGQLLRNALALLPTLAVVRPAAGSCGH